MGDDDCVVSTYLVFSRLSSEELILNLASHIIRNQAMRDCKEE